MDKSNSKTFPNVKIGVVGGSKGIFNNWNQVLTNRLSTYQNIGFVLHYYPVFSETVDLNNALEYQQFISTTATDLEKNYKIGHGIKQIFPYLGNRIQYH